ncbi:allantoinase PuuE [Vibrio nigripulchritudo]|uniref:allantoinase PuuE n=1 Tax=Vibrio nigripulchritudo TaxID=28173 RepID=UPI0003B1E6A3|nr:allantoinase PuuE [Vibrio nigripulchritudo]CCN69431.1 Allantoinase [Vibrio nigripulchritudo SFn118]
MKSNEYPRDLIGYGQNPPDPKWPGGARLALSFVLNYEEGGERCILHGDAESEAFLSEIPAAQPIEGQRHISMESIYEYGSRAGVWRILALFEKYNMPLTVFAVAMALERYPELAKVFVDAGHEICSHGYRWVDYQGIAPDLEKADMLKAISVIKALTGDRPLGWYTGRTSPNTRKLVAEEGGFLYDSDAYDDDLPYWHTEGKKPQLVIPYTLDVNDMRFATVQGFNSGEQFFQYLKDTFDTLYEEGERAPKMMSVGLHCRLIGKPGRIASLKRFLDYVQQHPDVWVCRRVDIAKHWHQHHPFETSHKK